MIIGCDALRYEGTIKSIRRYLFNNGINDPNNLDNVYLMDILGYESDFPVTEGLKACVPFTNMCTTVYENLIIDDYVRILADYLTITSDEFYLRGMHSYYFLSQSCRMIKKMVLI